MSFGRDRWRMSFGRDRSCLSGGTVGTVGGWDRWRGHGDSRHASQGRHVRFANGSDS